LSWDKRVKKRKKGKIYDPICLLYIETDDEWINRKENPYLPIDSSWMNEHECLVVEEEALGKEKGKKKKEREDRYLLLFIIFRS